MRGIHEKSSVVHAWWGCVGVMLPLCGGTARDSPMDDVGKPLADRPVCLGVAQQPK